MRAHRKSRPRMAFARLSLYAAIAVPACLLPKAELSPDARGDGGTGNAEGGNLGASGGRRLDAGFGGVPTASAGTGGAPGNEPSRGGSAGNGGTPAGGSAGLGIAGTAHAADGGAAENGGSSGAAGASGDGALGGSPIGGTSGASGSSGSGGTLSPGTIRCGTAACRVTGASECCFREFDQTASCQPRQSSLSCVLENVSAGGGQTSWWRTDLRCNTSRDCGAAEVCCHEQYYTVSQTLCMSATDCVDVPDGRYPRARTPTCDVAVPDDCPEGTCQAGEKPWLPDYVGLCSDEP